jgi:hypothetical protein
MAEPGEYLLENIPHSFELPSTPNPLHGVESFSVQLREGISVLLPPKLSLQSES